MKFKSDSKLLDSKFEAFETPHKEKPHFQICVPVKSGVHILHKMQVTATLPTPNSEKNVELGSFRSLQQSCESRQKVPELLQQFAKSNKKKAKGSLQSWLLQVKKLPWNLKCHFKIKTSKIFQKSCFFFRDWTWKCTNKQNSAHAKIKFE